MKIYICIGSPGLGIDLHVAGQTNHSHHFRDYLEVRSCDVYTGPCVANAEMNLSGKEGMLVWSVREGTWKGTRLDGLSIVAVVEADGTLGDMSYQPRTEKPC